MPLLINAYSTLASPPEPRFLREPPARRDRSDPELVPHLQGFVGYVLGTVEGMDARTFGVLRHLQRVQTHYSFEVEDQDFDALAAWGEAANVLCFLPDGSVRDAAGNVLASQGDPAVEADAALPYPPDARERKARSEAELERLGAQSPAHLPPVLGAGEVRLRTAEETMRRMLALCAVAVRAESLSSEPLSLQDIATRLGAGVAALTPAERDFIERDAPDEETWANHGWRYESAALLQWALGLSEALPPPTAICDAGQIARIAIDHADEARIAQASLRPLPELLDALDGLYRRHWLVRQARLDEREPPIGLHPSVVYERHYALNWLLRFDEQDWDEVGTPT
ncbi:DUF4272 domain-containing protein [Lysobacter capsici]|uniref:DUF4272 domain-containing protein n=1 Tax=Lysobacter capsici TaxID=435897 RepID=UPI000BBAD4C0|nr:DUF4272 domain-containing protein [Lysobacter capsici]ATE74072.1 hypothetical protein CNO08_23530 [Lysobacter capsici]